MHNLSAETPQAIDLWPGNVVQASSCADQNIGDILEGGSIWTFYVNVPLRFLLVVSAARDFVLQLNEALDGELVGGIFEILADLRRWSI